MKSWPAADLSLTPGPIWPWLQGIDLRLYETEEGNPLGPPFMVRGQAGTLNPKGFRV